MALVCMLLDSRRQRAGGSAPPVLSDFQAMHKMKMGIGHHYHVAPVVAPSNLLAAAAPASAATATPTSTTATSPTASLFDRVSGTPEFGNFARDVKRDARIAFLRESGVVSSEDLDSLRIEMRAEFALLALGFATIWMRTSTFLDKLAPLTNDALLRWIAEATTNIEISNGCLVIIIKMASILAPVRDNFTVDVFDGAFVIAFSQGNRSVRKLWSMPVPAGMTVRDAKGYRFSESQADNEAGFSIVSLQYSMSAASVFKIG